MKYTTDAKLSRDVETRTRKDRTRMGEHMPQISQ